MTTPYAPMLSRDGTCLRMPDGSFERLESLPRYQPPTPAATPVSPAPLAPLAALMSTPAPVLAPAVKTNATKE